MVQPGVREEGKVMQELGCTADPYVSVGDLISYEKDHS